MILSNEQRPALLLIDIQKGFDENDYWGGERNNPDAELKARKLLDVWRKKELPVFHIRHCSTNPRSPLHETNVGNQFKDIVSPIEGENIICKSVNSGFIGTFLNDQLRNLNISTLIIAGLTTDHCVSTTTRMAGNLGFSTYLVADATATFPKRSADGEIFSADLIHKTAIASLKDEFATIVSAENTLKAISRLW